jgi:hypothetical protein
MVMLDDAAGRLVPVGALLVVGLAAGILFSNELRPVAKRVIRFGLEAADRAQELSSEALERMQDLVAEVQYEREHAATAAAPGRAAGRRAAAGS